jgi:tetratricopeptide (TPR) repeat protein
MTLSRYYLWLPLLLLQSGCAMLTSYSKMEPQVNKWVESQQYDRALDALGNVDPKDPAYQEAAKKRRQVEAMAASYEQDIRRKTRNDLDQGHWEAALDTYDEALDRLPQSAVLKDGLAQLHHEQEEKLEQLELERVLAHAQWLRKTLPTYEAIARVDPRSRSARQRLMEKREEAEEIAAELALHGNRALADNRLDTAEQTLPLAAALSDAPAIAESLKKLQQQQANRQAKLRAEREQRRQRQRAAEVAREKKIAALLKGYQQAYADKDFNQARRELEALQRADRGNSRWDKLAAELEQATEHEAERLFELGVTAYSRGQFEQAATHWRKALELRPEHKPAQENLERAERVLEKLQELKKKQEGGG